MMNGLLRVYKDYQIVLKPIHTDFATNAIEYCFEDFSEHIPYVWAPEIIYITTYRQTKPTWITARKFSTNLVGQISNHRLVTRVLERKNKTGRLGPRPQA